MATQKQQYLAAIKKIEEAKGILEAIGKDDQRDYDSDEYASTLGSLLSCDDGEAGLYAFVRGMA